MAQFPEYKRDFKYTNKLEENTAYMLLGHALGYDEKSKAPYIIGAIFAEEMYFWASVGKEICVKINCPGGGIMDGFSIMDAIRQTNASTVNVGVAASMAVSIMLSARKEKRSTLAYARMMIHPPSGKDKVAVDALRGSLTQILSDCSNYSKTQIEDMLKEGAPDTWIDSKEMKKRGLVSNIIPTNSEPEEVEEETLPALYNVYNKLIEKEMAEPAKPGAAGGDVNQAFIDISNKLTESTAAITAKDAEITELKNKLKAIEDADKASKLAAATALVDVAIKNKQIVIPEGNTTLKDSYIRMAQDAPDAFKNLLETNKPATRTTSVMNHMTGAIQQTPAGQEETYEYLANKNPKKLYDMMDNEPEKYQQLVNAWTEKVTNQKHA